MSIHETNRNIVRVDKLGKSADIHFGPSDDDYSYQQHHATIAHDGPHTDSRLGIKIIMVDGGSEVQWSVGDKFTSDYDHNYVGINDDGTLSFPFWTGDRDGDQEIPMYVEIHENVVRVYAYEGEPPEAERDKWLVFDSSKLDAEREDFPAYHAILPPEDGTTLVPADLLNAAIAVLDSESGVVSMSELAEAVYRHGGGDFRDRGDSIGMTPPKV